MRKSNQEVATVETNEVLAKPKRSRKKAAALLSVNMSTELVMGETGDPALDALMAELNGVGMSSDEVILPSDPEENELVMEAAGSGGVIEVEEDDDLLTAAVSGAEMLESYDTENEAETAIADLFVPKAAEEVAPKEKKARAAKEPKTPKAPKSFYGLDKVKRLSDRGVTAVMLKSEESLTGDDLAAAQQRTIDVVAASNQKVKNRTTNILEYVTGKANTLNNLIRVCFNLIEKDGVLVMGEKGNMWATMSACYDAGTIRSGGNNSVAALRSLQVIVATPAGYVKNPESALYERIAMRLTGGGSESVPVAEESMDVESVIVEAPTESEEVKEVVEETTTEIADAVA